MTHQYDDGGALLHCPKNMAGEGRSYPAVSSRSLCISRVLSRPRVFPTNCMLTCAMYVDFIAPFVRRPNYRSRTLRCYCCSLHTMEGVKQKCRKGQPFVQQIGIDARSIQVIIKPVNLTRMRARERSLSLPLPPLLLRVHLSLDDFNL